MLAGLRHALSRCQTTPALLLRVILLERFCSARGDNKLSVVSLIPIEAQRESINDVSDKHVMSRKALRENRASKKQCPWLSGYACTLLLTRPFSSQTLTSQFDVLALKFVCCGFAYVSMANPPPPPPSLSLSFTNFARCFKGTRLPWEEQVTRR